MNEGACTRPFAKSIAARIGAAGLGDVELVSEMPDSSSFGDAEAVFRLGPLILRFSMDRGQELVDVAFGHMPERFFLIDDVDIALGWKSIDEVVSRPEPERLESVLGRLAAHRPELSEAFSGRLSRRTRARIERAERDRGEAFMERLRGNQ